MAEQKYSLKEFRARKNWTQCETAKWLGISPQTYNAWERDISNVAVGKVQAVADLFGVRLDQIFLHHNMNYFHVVTTVFKT